jgi:hypothetical protein
MGHVIKRLPKLKELKNQFDKMGIDNFIYTYANREWMIGAPESIQFIEEKEIEWQNIISSDGGQKEDLTNH